MSDLIRVLSAARSSPWAIERGYGQTLHDVLLRRATVGRLNADELEAVVGARRAELEARRQAAAEISDSGRGVAVIPILGVLTPRGDFLNSSGQTSVQGITQLLREALASPSVGSILLDIDSPGGNVAGIEELAAEIAVASKPVVAIAQHMAASAAYWLASAASELVVSPSAEVGSIGVYAMHEDLSGAAEQAGVRVTYIHAGEHKVEGNPFEPLTDEARSYMQQSVDHYYGLFVKRVAKGRRVSVATVREDFGGGRMLTAERAVALGMADRVATFDATVASVAGASRRRRSAAAVDLRQRELDARR